MPKRQDIKSILLIGSGPIAIGQGCEFDYSGTQACKALQEEGYKIILINSNPATIMTDPSLANATYIEPIIPESIEKIIIKEQPEALLATIGGQTALNCAAQLYKTGVLKKHNVELIGASYDSICKADDRNLFKKAMDNIGVATTKSIAVKTTQEAEHAFADIGLPAIIRPSFTLGGKGAGIAYTESEFIAICEQGLNSSPIHEILIDKSIIGWKEYEMELVRDSKDNCIVVCTIENFDPMGVHTGDSITVAPAQTLSDKEYQYMRELAFKVIKEIGVETGGANVQFAVNPKNGEMLVVEMNPRVSRSSALASKATGYPIAKIAAKLSIGYTLDELFNEITNFKIPACFEPSLDYVITKIPRFDMEKFPNADKKLGIQMKSVGEIMAIGKTFQESIQKAICSLESDFSGFDKILDTSNVNYEDELITKLSKPDPDRLWYIGDAFRIKYSVERVHSLTKVDPWFLYQINELIEIEQDIQQIPLTGFKLPDLIYLKQKGFSDSRIAYLINTEEGIFRNYRKSLGCYPSYKRIDTCAGEFNSTTDYLYSSYDSHSDIVSNSPKKKIVILGSGPNRIGQGIEFDYCCVHAAQALEEEDYEAIMINCNPETVSTDYDVSSKLYFEPLTAEHVLAICDQEQPLAVLIQYGGQTPIKLGSILNKEGIPILGTNLEAIEKTEDRQQFKNISTKLGLLQAKNGTVNNIKDGLILADKIGYPVILRPSYVLGGRAMKIIYNKEQLASYFKEEIKIFNEHPILIEEFLCEAIEIDVDAVCDGKDVVICGILEHIEQAGVHSGDSASCFPTLTLSASIQKKVKMQIKKIALEINIIGLINAQFAIIDEKVFIIEVNSRASRTIPFISKATNIPWAKIAIKCMLGKMIVNQDNVLECIPPYYFVKESVFPFIKLQGCSPMLNTEMKSTGEVMGIGRNLGEAYMKSQCSSGFEFPKKLTNSCVLILEFNYHKKSFIDIANSFIKLGFSILAPENIKSYLNSMKIACNTFKNMNDNDNFSQLIQHNSINLIIHIEKHSKVSKINKKLLEYAINNNICYSTTIPGTQSFISAFKSNHDSKFCSLQEIYT